MLTCTTEVSCPQEQAFPYVTDPSRFGEWQRDVLDGRTEGDGPARGRHPMRHAAAYRPSGTLARLGDHPRDPPNTWCLRGMDGPIRATVHVPVDPIDGAQRSRVTINIHFEGSEFDASAGGRPEAPEPQRVCPDAPIVHGCSADNQIWWSVWRSAPTSAC